MKLNLVAGVLLVLFLFQGCKKESLTSDEFSGSTNYKVELSRDQLNQRIANIIAEKNRISWNDLTDQELASAFRMAQDNVVTISWSRESSSNNEKDVIINKLKELEPTPRVKGEEQVVEVNIDLDIIDVRIDKIETLITLRNLPQVESIDVYYNPLTEEQLEEANQEIARGYSEQASYYSSLSRNGNPTTKDPVVGVYHNIDDAWQSSYFDDFGFGENIKVAVIDAGINPNNTDFGDGYNGIVNNDNKYGRYKDCWWCWWQDYDGPYSEPGSFSTGALISADHAIGRLEEIGFPYDDNGLTGVAYETEMISVRGTNSLAIDLSETIFNNVKGVQRSYEFLATRSDVKIVSMSNGALFEWSSIKNAVEDCKGSGANEKLIFNAAGTFPLGVYAEILLFQTAGEFTLFPASMPETEACTAIHFIGNIPQYALNAFGNADFVSRHNFPNGSSSEGTAYTAGMAALIWGTNPNMTAQQVRNKMIQASTSPSHNFSTFGFGMVDMQKFIDNEENSTETIIAFKGNNNKYVSSNNGTSSMKCDRNFIGSWEKFTLVDAGNGKKALRGNNGKYVSSNNGTSSMKCDRTNIGSWEKFTVVDAGGGKFALKGNNNKYVSSNNGTSAMKCDRNSIGSWEKFEMVPTN